MTPYVLVVEDEDALATLLDYNLMKEGFRVERAADAEPPPVPDAEPAPAMALQRDAAGLLRLGVTAHGPEHGGELPVTGGHRRAQRVRRPSFSRSDKARKG